MSKNPNDAQDQISVQSSLKNEDDLLEASDQECNDGDDNDGDSHHPPYLCTFPATGTNPAVQPIFVCLDCRNGDDDALPACVCEACADACHAGHVVEYVATGPAYCDCQKLVEHCVMKEVSFQKAKGLDIPLGGLKLDAIVGDGQGESYIQNVYSIQELEDPDVCRRLVEQATKLVQYTRDTHWISCAAPNDDEPSNNEMCELEELALSIFKRHARAYDCIHSREMGDGLPRVEDDAMMRGGAEWWVQVKKSGPGSSDVQDAPMDEAVDLHYDKDEELADTFGLGSFPVLSTVTYLTESPMAAPTVIFPRTYHTRDDQVIPEMVVSRPRRGKHLVFDGRLLHGAPSDPALQQQATIDSDESGSDAMKLRVTFLVNLWIDKRPSGVTPLSQDIRDRLFSPAPIAPLATIRNKIKFERRTILTMQLTREEDLPDGLRYRIELPFVSKGATWVEGDNHDDADNLVLVTFPPLPSQSDTIRVQFSPGLQAYLDNVDQPRTQFVDDDVADDGQDCYV